MRVIIGCLFAIRNPSNNTYLFHLELDCRTNIFHLAYNCIIVTNWTRKLPSFGQPGTQDPGDQLDQ